MTFCKRRDFCLCFNSRLREEATRALHRVPVRASSFNSRLREEATEKLIALNQVVQVSTHASVRRRRNG